MTDAEWAEMARKHNIPSYWTAYGVRYAHVPHPKVGLNKQVRYTMTHLPTGKVLDRVIWVRSREEGEKLVASWGNDTWHLEAI